MSKLSGRNRFEKVLPFIFAVIFWGVADVRADLIGDWSFDEGTGSSYAEDDINDNDGVLTYMNTGTCWVTGQSGYALEFDGIDDHVVITNPSGFDYSTGTIEFWMKVEAVQNGGPFHFYESKVTDYIRSYLASSGIMDLIIEDEDEAMVYVYYNLNDLPGGYLNQWLHVMWIQDGTGIRLHINGEEKTLGGIQSGNWWMDHLTLTGGYFGRSWGYFPGVIDEFKIYDQAFSRAEILDRFVCVCGGAMHFNCTCGGWYFDEGTGTAATGFFTANHDAALNNMNVPLCWVTGKIGHALEFDGADDYLSIANPSTLTSSATGAVEFWMKAGSVQNGVIFNFFEDADTDFICSGLQSDGNLYLAIKDNNSSMVEVSYNLNGLSDGYVGKWLHVIWIQDGTGVKLYVNGEQRTLSGTNSGNWWTEHLSMSQAYFGRGQYYFAGILDEPRIYNRTVMEFEVRQHYFAADAAGIWEFDEKEDDTAYDDSINESHLTLANMDTGCWIDGRIEGALQFDGNDDEASVSNPDGLVSTTGTIEFWMRADAAQNATIFHFYESKVTDYIRCHLHSDSRLDLVIEDDNVAKINTHFYLNNLSGGYIDRWLHIVWIQDGTDIKLYINGELKTLSGVRNGDWWTDHLAINTGRVGWGWDNFAGTIDHLNVFTRPLSSNEVSQRFTDHGGEYGFGYEEYTGDPVGGGTGYSEIYSANDADYVVTTKQELLTALGNASSGEIIFVNAASIDLTGECSIVIPAGVTLASNRGAGGTAEGALLYADQSSTPAIPLFLGGAGNVRVTGLRIQGPHSDIGDEAYDPPITRGIQAASSQNSCLEVDNCEIFGWSSAGIMVSAGTANIHHNYIHHCRRTGLGYGVAHGYSPAASVIEANKFDYCRHAVAATGVTGNSYEAKFNLVLEHANGHVFDVHGGVDRNDDTNIAGDNIYIHHNTVMVMDQYAVMIRGIPNNEALVYNNWFWRLDSVIQVNAQGNMDTYMNLKTPDRLLISKESQ